VNGIAVADDSRTTAPSSRIESISEYTKLFMRPPLMSGRVMRVNVLLNL